MSESTYSAVAIANAFLDRAKLDDHGISPMKIQKLIYFAHAWMLALSDQPLIKEPIKAWKFGPVIDTVYHEFKNFGSRDITNYGTQIISGERTPSATTFGGYYEVPLVAEEDKDVNALINRIWELYGDMSAVELSSLTHEPGTPWHNTLDEHKEGKYSNFVLSNDLIGDCMKTQLQTEEGQ